MPNHQNGQPPAEKRKMRLVLHIEVPGVYADDLPQNAADFSETGDPTAQDYLDVVLEEWMREDVGLTIVTQPGWGEMNEDFMVVAHNGRIVGAEVRPVDGQGQPDNRPYECRRGCDTRYPTAGLRDAHEADPHAQDVVDSAPNPSGGAS